MTKPVRHAAEILPEIGRGRLLAEITEHLQLATQAVQVHSKGAEITIKIKIAPFKENTHLVDGPVILTGEVESKLPKAAPEQSMFYADDDGNLNTRPERQRDLGLGIGAPHTMGGSSNG